MSTVKNPTKVITGKHTVMSYLNVNEPKTPLGGHSRAEDDFADLDDDDDEDFLS